MTNIDVLHMRCVKQCPQNARKANGMMVSAAAMAIKKACSVKKRTSCICELCMKIGVVDVGGGLRGIYAAGVLDYCMDQGIHFELGAAFTREKEG